jgi:3-oxoacyl-[acyl-carrier protein] reductase
MKTLKNKVALVTGASRGIGVAIAETLADAGAAVAVNYSRSEAEALVVVERIQAKGGRAMTVKCSVNDAESVKQMFAEVRAELGPVDILVNNAGITKDNLLVMMNDADFNAVIDVNLKGTYYCMREALADMEKKAYGKIVNISSVVGAMGNPGQTNYVASKGAVMSLTRSAAAEYGPKGVRVNAVAPGFIRTEMTDVLPEELQKGMIDNTMLKSFGTVEDVASIVRYLSLPESDYITGQIIHINGGLYV